MVRRPPQTLVRAGPIDLRLSTLLHKERGMERIPRKEVIQPHLPVRLPCYDFTPVTRLTLDAGPLRRDRPGRLQVPRAPMV